jgi:signal transduction histidine kinase
MSSTTQHTPRTGERAASSAGGSSEPPRRAADVAPEVPPQASLDGRLDAQRLAIVRVLSLGVALFSAVATPPYLLHATRSGHPGALAVACHSLLLILAGLLGVYFCRRGRLHAATCAVALPVISQATLVLAVLADGHGIAVINYCLVISIAALTLERRDWPRLAVAIAICSILGTVLHVFPVMEQATLPVWLRRATLIVLTPLGLVLPMMLFWLYGSHLHASREEAWELARTTARANEMKTEFLSTMSHELRSPIHVIIGNTQMLREGAYGAITSEQARTLQRMETYSIELLRLIESALEVSRLESGRMPVHPERFAIDDLYAEVLEAASVAAQWAGIEIRAVNPAGVHELETDRLKLKEILQNLAINAVKFTPEGHVEIRVARDGGDVVFEVEDTGIGIPPEDLPLIFDSFRQSRQTGDGWLRGVGLGLYIVKRLAELLGGSVTVESTLGRGTTFRVRLPIATVTMRAPRRAADAGGSRTPPVHAVAS